MAFLTAEKDKAATQQTHRLRAGSDIASLKASVSDIHTVKKHTLKRSGLHCLLRIKWDSC